MLPEQIEAVPEIIADEGLALIIILMLFDVAGEPVKHGEALLVKTTVTASLLFNVVVVNKALLAPALTPFILH